MVIFSQLLRSLYIFHFRKHPRLLRLEEDADKLMILTHITFLIGKLHLPLLQSIRQVHMLNSLIRPYSWFLSENQFRVI
jgi:hypothetical protein